MHLDSERAQRPEYGAKIRVGFRLLDLHHPSAIDADYFRELRLRHVQSLAEVLHQGPQVLPCSNAHGGFVMLCDV